MLLTKLLMTTINIDEIINNRISWTNSRYNFLLSIPLRLEKDNYELLKNSILGVYSNEKIDFIYDRPSLHISFGRFKINSRERFDEIVKLLNDFREKSNFLENIEIYFNNYHKLGKHVSLHISPIKMQISAIIGRWFNEINEFSLDKIPHITVVYMKDSFEAYTPKNPIIHKIRLDIKNIRLHPYGPVINNEGQNEYIEIYKCLHYYVRYEN